MAAVPNERLSTGIAGLDTLLHGGLIPKRSYLIRGGPGTGKTLLGLHFLTRGLQQGETCLCLYISLNVSEEKIRAIGASVGIDVNAMHFLDLTPPGMVFSEQKAYQFFSAAEAERGPIAKQITEMIERIHPTRVVVDAATHLRYLTPDLLQYRREMLSFLRYMNEQGNTLYLISETGATLPDDDLQFMTDGIITLSYQGKLRTISIGKYVASAFQPGTHSLRISDQGVHVYPELIPALHEEICRAAPTSSGIPELDALLHGGLECGTSTFVSGPTGTGKTTFGLTFLLNAAARGERSVIFAFDTSAEILMQHADGVNLPLRARVEQGVITILPIPSLYYTMGEFVAMIREHVERHRARLVMFDGYSSVRQSLIDTDLNAQMHELLAYLNGQHVTTIVAVQVETISGDLTITESGISYLADNIVFLRYLEINGVLRKAIGVLKKRLSDFEKTLREFDLTDNGVLVGKPLTGLRGILKGNPEWITPPRDEER